MIIIASFDEATQAEVAAAADQMAQQSPFQPQSVPLHARLGRLGASAEAARAALGLDEGHRIALTGQFLEWVIRDETLQLHAELDTSLLETQLAAAGAPFEPAAAPLVATVGSVAAMDPSHRAAFLDAVKSSFPCHGGEVQAVVDCLAADALIASQPEPFPPLALEFPPPNEAGRPPPQGRRPDKLALQSRLNELQHEIASRSHEIASRRRAVEGRAAPSVPARKDPKRGAGERAATGSAMEVEPAGRAAIKKKKKKKRHHPRPPFHPPSHPPSRRIEVVASGSASKSRKGPRPPAGRGSSRPGSNGGRGAARAGGGQ